MPVPKPGKRSIVFDEKFSEDTRSSYREIFQYSLSIVTEQVPELGEVYRQMPDDISIVITQNIHGFMRDILPSRLLDQFFESRRKLQLDNDSITAVGQKGDEGRFYVVAINPEVFAPFARAVAILLHELERIRRYWKIGIPQDDLLEEIEITKVSLERLKAIDEMATIKQQILILENQGFDQNLLIQFRNDLRNLVIPNEYRLLERYRLVRLIA